MRKLAARTYTPSAQAAKNGHIQGRSSKTSVPTSPTYCMTSVSPTIAAGCRCLWASRTAAAW